MADLYSKGCYELFTPGGVGKRIGVLRDGRVEFDHATAKFLVYANHLFKDLGEQGLGICVGEIDSSGKAIRLDGKPLFRVVQALKE